jgi:hypothetical protein
MKSISTSRPKLSINYTKKQFEIIIQPLNKLIAIYYVFSASWIVVHPINEKNQGPRVPRLNSKLPLKI